MTRLYDHVTVIGLDGVDWRVLRPWLDAGHLPTLAKLVREGASGRLMSTIRPESSVAWSSFATGVNPGQHDIYGFMQQIGHSGRFQIANSQHIQANRFWELLGWAGLRVGLLNVPFTYPPQPVNGFMITGMLTPNEEAEFAYPAALKQQVLQRFQSYLFDAGDDVKDKDVLLANARRFTAQQLESALWLLEENKPDFFAVVFTASDRLQHFYFADIDPNHPDHTADSPHRAQELLAYFQQLDDAIAQITAALPDNSLVLLLSDHGFNSFARRFYVNRWLVQEGWLMLNEGSTWGVQAAVSVLQKLKSMAWLRRLKRVALPNDWGPQKLATAVATQPIDWSQSKAYYAADGGIRLNLRGREPHGIVAPNDYEQTVETLRKALLALVDPATGQRPIAHVYTAAELYDGLYAAEAPDLIVEPQRSAAEARHNVIIDSLLDSETILFASSAPYSGNHDQIGMMLAAGPHVLPQQEVDAHIMDFAPTILTALGVPVPTYMDGRPLLTLFEPTTPLSVAYSNIPVLDTARRGEVIGVDEQDELVTERLRNLGYLD